MTTVSIKEANSRLAELIRQAESGKRVTITRNGKPVVELGPYQARGGLNRDAIDAFKKKHGVERIFGEIPEDFDDPLPEDFLLRPLP